MAWNFNGTTGYLDAAQAVVSAAPLTMACWFRKTDAPAAARELIALSDASAADQFFILSAGNEESPVVYAAAYGGGDWHPATSTTMFTANQWHHAAGVFPSNSQRHVFLDGGSKGSSSGAAAPLGIDHTGIAHLVFADEAPCFPGDIAEVAVWNAALTDEEIRVLAQGFSPLCLWHRLANLVAYQDLIRPLNRPGIGPAMTAAGGTSVAAHPRMIYPVSHSLCELRQLLFAVPYRLAAAAAHAGRVSQGWAALAGAEQGATCPIGEVSS